MKISHIVIEIVT